MTSAAPTPTARKLRIAAVLWSGELGGAERFTADLCRVMREAGADASVLFVTDPGRLGDELEAHGIPYSALDLRRGRAVLRSPRRFARAARELGPDGVILVSPGYLAAALKIGGYRGRVVAVLHDLVQPIVVSMRRRLLKRADIASGVYACDVEVAVSDYVRAARMRLPLRRRHVVRIYNGVDLEAFAPDAAATRRKSATLGWAGRLVEGKGLDTLIEAVARTDARTRPNVLVAGDGPLRSALESQAQARRVQDRVTFLGWAPDMATFWRGCDVAAVPADDWIESFGMVAAEAMACGVPVVASRSGALPELVEDGVTGRIVPPGDADALSAAIGELLADPARREAAARASRERCERHFDLRRTADAYLDLFRAA